MREWTEVGFSSIYYLLNKLEKKKYITSRTEQTAGRGPARKVYYITDNGRSSCRQATLEALKTPHRSYAQIQLGLANLPGIDKTAAIDALRQHLSGLNERLRHIKTRRKEQQPTAYFVEAMFEYSITMVEAEIKWIKKFIQTLEGPNVEN